jgi:hypothetical protein
MQFSNELSTPTAPDDGMIRHADAIVLEDLQDLFGGTCRAISIKSYYPTEICEIFAEKVNNHQRIDGYVVDRSIKRFGMSFYDTAKDASLLNGYFEQAVPTMRDLRNLCLPDNCPLDRLRLELDETWPGGASIATLRGRKMMAGIARVFNNGVGALAHVDTLGFDAIAFPDAPPLITQVSANLYLRIAQGGELALWSRRILSPQEEEACRLSTSSYGLDEAKIGPPTVTIRPEVGQLILFDSTRCHAVRPSKGGSRITMSLFVGLGRDGKLRLWN